MTLKYVTPSAPPLDDKNHYSPSLVQQQQPQEVPIVAAIPVTVIPVTATPINDTPVGGAYTAKPAQAPVTGMAPNVGPTTTTTTTTNVIKIEDLGRESVEFTCPFCGHRGRTKVTHEFSAGSLVWIIVMCFLFWPAVFCVCCCKELQDSIHRCKNCRRVVARTPSYAECC